MLLDRILKHIFAILEPIFSKISPRGEPFLRDFFPFGQKIPTPFYQCRLSWRGAIDVCACYPIGMQYLESQTYEKSSCQMNFLPGKRALWCARSCNTGTFRAKVLSTPLLLWSLLYVCVMSAPETQYLGYLNFEPSYNYNYRRFQFRFKITQHLVNIFIV